METALRALSDKGKARVEEEATPPGLEIIDRVENPVDKAQLLLLMYLIYPIGPLAASMAVMAGAPMKAAYAVHDLMILALALEAEEICTAWGIGRFAFAEEPGISISMFLIRLTGSASPSWPARRLTCKPGKLGPVNGVKH
jgi:hypothetical protein